MTYSHSKYQSLAAMVLILNAMLPSCSKNPDQNAAYSLNTKPYPTKLSPGYASIAFGKEAWEDYFGEVDEEPALPDNINEILDSDCPFWPGKKIKETHLLVMIPKVIKGVAFKSSQMIALAQSPKRGTSTRGMSSEQKSKIKRERTPRETIRDPKKFFIRTGNAEVASYEDERTQGCLEDLEKTVPSHTQSYWVLMTRDVVNTTGKTNSKDLDPQYDAPTVLEAAAAILTHYVRSGEWIYEENHTYCKEKISDNGRSIFIGKSRHHDQLAIDNKTRTAIKIEGGDAPDEDIPPALIKQALLRRF